MVAFPVKCHVYSVLRQGATTWGGGDSNQINLNDYTTFIFSKHLNLIQCCFNAGPMLRTINVIMVEDNECDSVL